MIADQLYTYTETDFGPNLPPDLFAAAQTEAELQVQLLHDAQPVTINLKNDRLGAPVRLGGLRFGAGDRIRHLWTLVDHAKSMRLMALQVSAHDRETGALIGSRMVLASALPLNPGQAYLLARPVIGAGAAALPLVGFAAGCRILTDQGKRPVEELRPHDRLWCTDGRFRPLLWCGTQTLEARGVAAPVRLRRGYRGLSNDLLLAPFQGVQIETEQGPALAPACAFVDRELATREFGGLVTWHHLLLAAHAVILVNGLACDTLWHADMPARARPADWPETLAEAPEPVLPRLSRQAAQRWCR